MCQRAGEFAFAGALGRALRFGDAVLDRHRLGERPPRRLILEQPISDEVVPVAVKGRLEGMEKMVRSAGFGGAHPIVERSEEHTSELQSLMRISYAVFCLKKKKIE